MGIAVLDTINAVDKLGRERAGYGCIADYLIDTAHPTPSADVERRIADLKRVREGLATLIDACPGHGRAADCPILKALGGEDSE